MKFVTVTNGNLYDKPAVPNLLAPGTSFVEDSFSTNGEGCGGMVQAVTQVMGSDGEQQMRLSSLAHCSPPALRPGSQQAVDLYRSLAWGLGTPAISYFGG